VKLNRSGKLHQSSFSKDATLSRKHLHIVNSETYAKILKFKVVQPIYYLLLFISYQKNSIQYPITRPASLNELRNSSLYPEVLYWLLDRTGGAGVTAGTPSQSTRVLQPEPPHLPLLCCGLPTLT
jgi:hypothetical protein